MAFGVTEDEVRKLINEEIINANKNNPPFSSDHEAIAVIKEELEETQEAFNELQADQIIQWEYIKNNGDWIDKEFVYERMFEDAIQLIREGIQVAAMARKAIASGRKNN